MPSPTESTSKNSSPFLRVLGATVFVLVLGIAGTYLLRPASSVESLLDEARDAIRRNDLGLAKTLLDRATESAPENFDARFLLGKVYSEQKEFQLAVEEWATIRDPQAVQFIDARCESGQLQLMELKQPALAELEYRQVLKHDPNHILANYRLSYLLGLSGRSYEALPIRLKLIRLQQIDSTLLYLISTGSKSLENVEAVTDYAASSPDDPLITYALALREFHETRYSEAERLLNQISRNDPTWIDTQLKRGEIFLLTQRFPEFLNWHQSLSLEFESRPELWILRAQWAQQAGQSSAALRCYGEAVQRDPMQQEAVYQMARLLRELNDSANADRFLKRSDQLQRYYSLVKDLAMSPDPEAAHTTAKLAEELGLLHEAYGWAFLVAQQFSREGWARESVARLGPQIEALPLMRTSPTVNLVSSIDLSRLPLPHFGTESRPETSTQEESPQLHQIRFKNEAAETGLEFSYFNGSARDQQTRRMYEFLGGGVGVLDYDGDHRPDLWFTQGNRQFTESQNPQKIDAFYRNMESDRFRNVSHQIGVLEGGFSTGVAAADFDNDGFTDLLVCNIGQNRLLRNNGDGTFEDVTLSAGILGESWSTSAVFADFNGDGQQDLYITNYLTGDDLYTRVCYDEYQHPHSCIPANFDGQDDQLFLNIGDGTFQNISSVAGLVPGGKGLGVIAAELDGEAGLELFVANDAEPNFFYRNQATNDETPQLEEQALLRGLALNEAGAAEACMGIAVADINDDRRLDLFVTNFYQESNTLYINQPGGIFRDQTRTFHLSDGSLKMLGFGTQFFDADHDSHLDLILTNGHVDDLTDRDEPYTMPAQFYRGLEQGFELLAAERLGDFFSQHQLGRGLALLDWNEDGLEDVVVSHLDTPAALLTNKTQNAGHYLGIRLRGTESTRDATGAILTLTAGKRSWTRHLIAGSGFQATSELRISFGLGKTTKVDELTCQWPSGLVQSFSIDEIDRTNLLIEGQPSAVHWP